MSPPHDWASGPAKWAAVLVLGGSSIFGIAWSAATRASGRENHAQSRTAPAPQPVPLTVEPVPIAVTPEAVQKQAPPSLAPQASATRRININTATASELELLPGIGPAMASRILDYRKTNGRFRSIEDLDNVKGIGPRTLEKLRPLIRVD